MAQKSQNAGDFEVHSSASSTSAAKDASGTSTARKQSATPTMNGTVSTVLPKMSDLAPVIQTISESSQPMEKSVSNGSNGSAKDANGETASPYGTRSRNRNGNSRINYAEDKDMDVEIFEMYPERRDDDSKKSARQLLPSSAPQGNILRAGTGSSRKPLPDDSKSSSSQGGTKDRSAAPTPGSISGANSTASASISRKRKAVSQPSVAANQAQPAPNGHSAALQKKLGAVLQGGNGYAETNLLTFENCGARPKGGKMVADDGTVLEVNSKCIVKLIRLFLIDLFHF